MSEIPARVLTKRQWVQFASCVAQLRHLYSQMIGGYVTYPGGAARGLLGPVIERLEKLMPFIQPQDPGKGRDEEDVCTCGAAFDVGRYCTCKGRE